MRNPLLFVLLLACHLLSGQTEKSTGFNALSARTLVLRHDAPEGKSSGGKNTYGMEFAVHRQFNNFFGATLPVKLAVIDLGETENYTVAIFDLQANYFPFGAERKLAPYLTAGLGFVLRENGDNYGQYPTGAGINLELGTNVRLQLQLERRWSATQARNTTAAGIGYVYRFGGLDNSDADGDGVPDRLDECPDRAGVSTANGCPDADLDGVIDGEDRCPDIPGLKATFGCPDRDEDGIADQKDRCPEEAGTRETLGCPDYDKDGVPDIEDKCPAQPGKKLFQGCPDTDNDGVPDDIDPCPNTAGNLITGCPDRDGDGFHDGEDQCPDTAGPNGGCPEIDAGTTTRLEQATNRVSFTGRTDQLKTGSENALDDLAAILKENPAYDLVIEGHTANDGTEQNNQALSELRALSCRGYLITKGIAPGRIKVIGRGASRPRADNNTATGRELNRRMVFLLVPGGR